MAWREQATFGSVKIERNLDVDAVARFAKLLAPSQAITATSDGLTTGTIADSGSLTYCAVTSAAAANIVVLPTPTPGTIVVLGVGANGFELRTSDPATIAINGGSGANAESAIAADSLVIIVCTSATTWQGINLAGTTLAAIEAAVA
jgi:hypothetical protein